MKKFLVDLTEVKVNPMSNELNYKVGDIIPMHISCEIFGDYIIKKKVVKIDTNKYHNQKYYFVQTKEELKTGYLSIKDMLNKNH